MLHGFDGGFDQNRIALNYFEICNVPLTTDYDSKKHISSDVILPSLPRIDRIHFVANQTVSHS